MTHLNRRQWVTERVRELPSPVAIVRPAELLVDDADVAEEVGDYSVGRLSLDADEENRATAVQMFLQSRDLEIGIDLLVCLDEIAFSLQRRPRWSGDPESLRSASERAPASWYSSSSLLNPRQPAFCRLPVYVHGESSPLVSASRRISEPRPTGAAREGACCAEGLHSARFLRRTGGRGGTVNTLHRLRGIDTSSICLHFLGSGSSSRGRVVGPSRARAVPRHSSTIPDSSPSNVSARATV